MTLRIPKPGTGSAWSRRYWAPEEHSAVPLLLSLRPATRRWLFGVPGAGRGFYWTRTTGYPNRDTDAEWEVGSRSLTLFAATGSHEGYGLPLPEDADVDRALWLPENPWAVLEALMSGEPLSEQEIGIGAGITQWPRYEGGRSPYRFLRWDYTAKARGCHVSADTLIGAVLRLADQIVGGKA